MKEGKVTGRMLKAWVREEEVEGVEEGRGREWREVEGGGESEGGRERMK